MLTNEQVAYKHAEYIMLYIHECIDEDKIICRSRVATPITAAIYDATAKQQKRIEELEAAVDRFAERLEARQNTISKLEDDNKKLAGEKNYYQTALRAQLRGY